MYKSGDLKSTTPPCSDAQDDWDGICICGEIHKILDNRTNHYNGVTGIYLPHSCEQWVIGGKEEIQALIADLTEVLSKLK